MATVYVADDLKHHRKVAIKVLHPELSAVLGADQPDGTSLTRVVALPSGCSATLRGTAGGVVTIGAGGTVVACTVRRYTPDVWLADRAGKSGW